VHDPVGLISAYNSIAVARYCCWPFQGLETLVPGRARHMHEQLISSTSSSEDENDLHQLTVNEHYAKAFQYRKEREELAKRARHQSFIPCLSN